MVFRRICSWCQRELSAREVPGPVPDNREEPVTHTICPDCQKKVFAEIQAVKINNEEHSQGETK
jgi:hypothetical protein